MAQEYGPEIIGSPPPHAVTQDGIAIRIMIYRPEYETRWALEVVDHHGGSTTWDDLFPTDENALKEALATVAKEGIRAFLVEEEKPGTLH